jgi:glycogen phosphorylase
VQGGTLSTRSTRNVSSARTFKQRFLHNLRYARGLELEEATGADQFAALALTVREQLVDRAVATKRAYRRVKPKTVYYLSMEYMLGRALHNNLVATGMLDVAREAMTSLGLDLGGLLEEEPDPGLGSGGLGRLAACFMESLATLDIPAIGYGLRYDYGIFRQEFRDGWQHERPDTWLRGGHVWAIHRADLQVPVPVGGHVERHSGHSRRARWVSGNTFFGVPHDVLIAGFNTPTVAILRLWRAESPQEFDLEVFSQGDFLRAVAARERVDAITKVLYPSDAAEAGRQLRLLQEYFLVACSVRDILKRFRRRHDSDWSAFPEKVAIQLNDTHPALAVAELMRFFVDEAGLPWAKAWPLVVASCGYTNHTLLPEALETWPVALFEHMLPRHAQIIYEINSRFLQEVSRRLGGDIERMRRMSLVQEDGDRQFRMAHLAIVGSHHTNGVAKLHAELLTKRLVRDFAELWPERFLGITNGITPRRWLAICNPRLADAVSRRIGDDWRTDLMRLGELERFADDREFQEEFLAIKLANKRDLAREIRSSCGIEVDPASLFDVQVKRLHEYKRQLLAAMHIIALYRRIKAKPKAAVTPRTFIFAAKAAPAYRMAKLVIKLINSLAEVVNRDTDVAGRLRVIFMPDYRVSLAEKIIPAADLSEQISTAGKEASGTGNMKFALNGALTIGTLDGANVEIRDAVGAENIFIFGLTAEEVERSRAAGYDPWRRYREDRELAGVLDDLRDGAFVDGDQWLLRDVWSSLLERGDFYMHLADFGAYRDTQEQVARLFGDRHAWAAMAIRNVAAMGYFSSDRAIAEYAEKIWRVSPAPVAGGRVRTAGATGE